MCAKKGRPANRIVRRGILEAGIYPGGYLVLIAALLNAQHHLEQGDKDAKEGADSHHQENTAQVTNLQGHGARVLVRVLHTPTHARAARD